MVDVGPLLQTARDAARLSASLLARLAGLAGEQAVLDAEAGRHELTATELDQCARVFGVRLDDLLNGDAGRSPLSLLLRSNLEGQAPDIQELVATELHQGLGDFLRVVRDIADVERALGRAGEALPRLAPLPARPGEHPGEARARTLREHLDLGVEPVASMRRIVEDRLGIRVVWVTEEHMDRAVDGACAIEPRPAILVNLLEPERYPWRTRITLAHELCHLLFDEDVRTRRALMSPHGAKGIGALKLEEIERVARAFAACFLAPADGVRRELGGVDPTSEEAIRIVGSTFGVGRTVAINRLQHVCRLSDAQRGAMEMRAGLPYDGDFGGDAVDEPLGFRGGALYGLVHEAIRERRLSGTKARRLIGLTSADPLPFEDIDEGLRAPLVSAEQRACRRANALLAERGHEGVFAARAEAGGGDFRVEVMRGGIGARDPQPAGHLLLSSTGELIEDSVEPAPGE